MVDLVEQLREAQTREFHPETLRTMVLWAADEIDRLRGPDDAKLCVKLSEENDALIEENKRLRAALTTGNKDRDNDQRRT